MCNNINIMSSHTHTGSFTDCFITIIAINNKREKSDKYTFLSEKKQHTMTTFTSSRHEITKHTLQFFVLHHMWQPLWPKMGFNEIAYWRVHWYSSYKLIIQKVVTYNVISVSTRWEKSGLPNLWRLDRKSTSSCTKASCLVKKSIPNATETEHRNYIYIVFIECLGWIMAITSGLKIAWLSRARQPSNEKILAMMAKKFKAAIKNHHLDCKFKSQLFELILHL